MEDTDQKCVESDKRRFLGRDYRKIKAWQAADDLTVSIYKITERFPKHEVYALTSQVRRSASAVPANIAEGSARGYKKEYLQFLNIARGSLAETDYFMHLAHRLGYIETSEYRKIANQIKIAATILYGLLEAVRKET